MKKKRVAVLGGGAAGFFSAITAAEVSVDPLEIVIFEKTKEVLQKVKISGGGRCNVTHSCFEPKQLVQYYPRGTRELINPFFQWQPQDTVQWFEEREVKLKTEPDGRMFPVSDRSESIVQCLSDEAKRHGIKIYLNCEVKFLSVSSKKEEEELGRRYLLRLSSGDSFSCDAVIVAIGGTRTPRALDFLQGLDEKVVEDSVVSPVPSLFSFHIKDSRIEGLQGISVPFVSVEGVDCQLKTTGSVLITHHGLTGPAILKLSAWGARTFHEFNYRFKIKINWLGEVKTEEVISKLNEFRQANGKKLIEKNSPFDLPTRFWQRLIREIDLPSSIQWAGFSKEKMKQLVRELTTAEFQVDGKSMNKEEFVTCGGIDLKGVDLRKMESKQWPGIYFVGEVLNVDGVTGGFNFQSAWTTGRLAGLAIASSENA